MNEKPNEFALSDYNEYPKSLEEFERNYDKKHPGSPGCCHNIYHLVATDRDGNVVDEAFGINCMTDYGFKKSIGIDTPDNSDYIYLYGIYLGDGDGLVDPASSAMIHPLSNTSGAISNRDFSHWNTKWVPDLHCNRVQYRLCIATWDYTFWNEDHDVKEIGLSAYANNSPNYLLYHANVYDSEGNISSFKKKVNQKLTVTVYARWMVPIERIVNELWDKGFKAAIRSNSLCFWRCDNFWSSLYYNIHTYAVDGSNHSDWYPYINFKGWRIGGQSIVDNIWTRNANLSINIFIEGKHQYMSDLTFSNTSWYSAYYGQYFMIAGKIYAPEPVDFQDDNFRTINYKSLSLKWTYGWYTTDTARSCTGQLPMTTIHIESLKMYNAQTDAYDIDVPFVEPVPYLAMDIQHLRFSIREYGWIDFRNEYKWFTVFLNESTQYPISKIIDCGRTMWVTDTYWDTSTWDIVPNTNEISSAQGSKRFFIMFEEYFDHTNDGNDTRYFGNTYYNWEVRRVVRPTFDAVTQRLDLNDGIDEDNINFGYQSSRLDGWIMDSNQEAGKAVQNETYGYIAQDAFLVYPDSIDPNPQLFRSPSITTGRDYPYVYPLGGIELTNPDLTQGNNKDYGYRGFIWNAKRGEHIVVFGRNSLRKGCRVYTVNIDPSIAPTYDDFSFDATFNENPMWSNTSEGYMSISYIQGSTNTNETYILEYDVNGVTPNMHKITGYHHGVCVDLTTYFVGINSNVTTHLSLDIYDMSTRTVVDTIDIPEGYTFQGLCGWNNWIYIRVDQSGAKSTYVYHIREQILELTPLNLQHMEITTSSCWSHIQRSVEGRGNIESCMILFGSNYHDRNDHHYVFKESDPLHPFKLTRDDAWEISSNVTQQKAWLGYSADNKHLLATFSGRRCATFDVGWVLRHGTQSTHRQWGDLYQQDVNWYTPIYYKGYIYQMRMFGRSNELYGKEETSNEHYYYEQNHRFWRSPFQCSMDLQIIGKTRNITSFMNPVRAQGTIASATYECTNRGIDSADPYVPPV